jgi:hypothetical protein
MMTTRKIGRDGFGAKTRVLDDNRTGKIELKVTREMWANMQNRDLERHGHDARVDHRSKADQRAEALARGDHRTAELLSAPPEKHMGPEVSGMERREERRATKEGRPYEAVTERGKEVQEIREAKSLLARLVAVRDALKERLAGPAPTQTQQQPEKRSFLGRMKDKLTPRSQKPMTEERQTEAPKSAGLFERQAQTDAKRTQERKDRQAADVAQDAQKRADGRKQQADASRAAAGNKAKEQEKQKTEQRKQKARHGRPLREVDAGPPKITQPSQGALSGRSLPTRDRVPDSVGKAQLDADKREVSQFRKEARALSEYFERKDARNPIEPRSPDSIKKAAQERVRQSREARDKPRDRSKDRSNDRDR